MEMKVILCMAVRRFDVRPAYEEWDGGKAKGGGRRFMGRGGIRFRGAAERGLALSGGECFWLS